MQQRIVAFLYASFFLVVFCVDAQKNPLYNEPLFKIEYTIESEARLTVFAHDFTYDSRDGDVTHEHVFYRDNDQESVRIDFNHQELDSCDSSYRFDNASDSSHVSAWDTNSAYDVTSYLDVESNRREMQSNFEVEYNADLGRDIRKYTTCDDKNKWPYVESSWPDGITFQEELELWQKELDLWEGRSLSVAQFRYNARKEAYLKTKDNPCDRVHKKYKISKYVVSLIEQHNNNPQIFKSGFYNPLQHQLHLELTGALQEMATITCLTKYPKELSTAQHIVSFAAVGVQYNKIGDVLKTAAIADFCWATLECGYAVIAGATAGFADIAQYAFYNPHELVLYGLAPEIMAGYYTLKLAYSLGCLTGEVCKKGPGNYINEITQDITVPGAVFAASSFVVRWRLNKELDGYVKQRMGACKESFIKAVESKQPELALALNNVGQLRSTRLSEVKGNKNLVAKNNSNQQIGRQLTLGEKLNHETFLQKLAQKVYPGKKDAKICFKDILPSDPSKLEEMGWRNVTDLRNNKGISTLFRHDLYNLKIRFDKAVPRSPGFKGKDHYQIYNPLIEHKNFEYLDIHGEIVRSGKGSSHILLSQLDKTCLCRLG